MIFILMTVGVLMKLLSGTADFNLGAMAAPLLLIAVPCMAIVAAIAVLFETLPWLRGGLGNIIYFFLFMFALVALALVLLATFFRQRQLTTRSVFR